MARPKGSTNKKEEEVVEETVVSDSPSVVVKEQFDPSLPESKQRHLR